jgi:type I restriction enzyme S subunit
MNWADQEYAIGRGIAAIRHREGARYQPFIRGVIELSLGALLVQATGSTFPNVSKAQLEQLHIPSLSLRIQAAISEVLGALDDKIQLNRKMNATLDELARTLFRGWFVDFDPVRAKMEGREPFGMDADTAALFPDRLVESPLGPIPEGWEVLSLGNIVGLSRSSVKPQDNPETEYFHYSIPAFDSGETPEVALGETIKSSKYLVPENSVLLSKLNPRIPRIWMPSKPDTSGRSSIASTEFLVLVPKDGVPRSFITALVSNPSFIERFASLVSGTSNSHQRVRPKDAQRIPVVFPSNGVVEKFAEQAEPLYELLLTNRDESQTLTSLRDTLLPELIFGRIRVPEAENAVAEVV